MNKAQSIQRSKLVTSYGGVGSIIDTIDNLAYMIEPFDCWNLYKQQTRCNDPFANYKTKDKRLKARLRNLGFSNLEEFFLPYDNFDEIKVWNPREEYINRMVTAKYAPKWFYCEKCHSLNHIDTWKDKWKDRTSRMMEEPKCHHCCTGTRQFRAPRLQQVRFVLASLENGELKDIPWDKLWSVNNGDRNFYGPKGYVNRVWDFRDRNISTKDVTFHTKKGGSDLIDIYIKSNNIILTMAEVMSHYFILEDNHVYQPVIRSANNVYFTYNMSSLYIPPRHIISQDEVDNVLNFRNNGITAPNMIKNLGRLNLSIQDIQYIIDNEVAPNPDYTSEERFRMDEYDQITNDGNYKNGQYKPDTHLDIWKYNWSTDNAKPMFVKNIYLLKHLEVTTVQVAYSRLERVSAPDYTNMTGDTTKQWFDKNKGVFTDKNIKVGLHPTCNTNRDQIHYMPASVSCGEGFFVELDLQKVTELENKKVFTHTFAHLVMKELEFSCGYPLASMNERLYILPTSVTCATEDKYGFLIYSANGEAGSYGGISSLFDNHTIEKILNNAIELADDCPNDPICESHKASCFACVQIPETACELFNEDLSRKIFKTEEIKFHSKQNSGTDTQSSSSDTHSTTDSLEGQNKDTKSTDFSNSTSKITKGVILG